MADPTVTVEIAFASAPGDAPVWTDVSAYAQEFGIRRGRQSELGRMESGTATVVLLNTDRRFEPDFAAGAYYPNVLLMRRLRISATYGGTTYYLFEGFIDSWPPSYPDKTQSTVTITAADGFKVLNLAKLSETYAEERSDTRIGNVLDDADWPAGDRDIDTGQTTVQGVTLSNTSALDHLHSVVEAEAGMHFIARDGDYTFIDRHSLLLSPYNTSQVTFGFNAGEFGFTRLQLAYDDTDIWNLIRYTRTGGSEQTAQDATSQTAYLIRARAKSGLLQTTDNEVANAAEYDLARYKDPHLGVKAITFRPYGYDALWPELLERELGDRVTVQYTPVGGGAEIDQEVLIQSISHNARVGRQWTTTLQLSAADTQNYWILGDATYSVLGTTTRLAY